MSENTVVSDNDYDNEADKIIAECLAAEPPISFFLFAGAGSGKTRSLEKALEELEKGKGEQLRFKGKRVGVITYTNKACDEIKHRVNYNSLFHIATIHSFAWTLIECFTEDIRFCINKNLQNEIAELKDKLSKAKNITTKTYMSNLEKLNKKQKRLNNLPSVRRFTYNPDGDNYGLDSLNHAEVIKIVSWFLTNKPLMRKVLVSKYPILLIDESQDTHRALMDSLLLVQSELPRQFAIGVIGDMMQRIYTHGKDNLDENVPEDWKMPFKEMNHRSRSRIVELINKIRFSVDRKQQRSRSDKEGGFARLFIRPAGIADKLAAEAEIYNKMAEITHDEKWRGDGRDVKTLILEHRMAAQRLGFLDMWTPLDEIDRLKTGLRDGSLPALGFFSRIILPLVQAYECGDRFAMMNIARKHSAFLDKKKLEKLGDAQFSMVERAKDAITSFFSLWDDVDNPSFLDVLHKVKKFDLFPVPESLVTYILPEDCTQYDSAMDDDETKESVSFRCFLDSAFLQIGVYNNYINGNAIFDTHHGVKGLEFPRVCVVMDDTESNWNQFQYEALFGLKESKAIETTRRLFYVTCSRAQDSLALVAYSSGPSAMKDYVIEKQWFSENEVDIQI